MSLGSFLLFDYLVNLRKLKKKNFFEGWVG
jgi:hypothetical protein